MSSYDLSRAAWRKSSFSGNTGNCVEIAATVSGIAVRDSKNPGGGVLVVRPQRWQKFLADVKSQRP
jgi:Domain of unknown function (DUF397)